ncbi:MAG: hypothetical protein ACI8VC_002504 [Candidatus Endobugula sp.]|jgi:hypothetical protein
MLKRRYFLVLPFLILIVMVLCFCVADLFAMTAIEYENQWRRADIVESQQEWDKAVAIITKAIALNPLNPRYPEIMGRVYIWRYYIANSPVTSIEQSQRILDKGMYYIQSSIDMRPTWLRARSTRYKLNQAAEIKRAMIISQE